MRGIGEKVMEPKISLVIPVYGTEKYLERCINSVINQIYYNIEIIVVNDCSPGNAKEIIEGFQKKDLRIKYIEHDKNQGLFQARITGAKEATGDYIAFLDSDDYIAFDFYYSLVKKIQEESADIVIGKTVIELEDGSKFINHFHDCSLNLDKLEGKQVRETFFSHRGRCYSWHTIWNKLYSMKLWGQAVPFYEDIKTHVIMTEDIAFSSVLFYFAQKVVTVNSSAYFYCMNEGASTNSKNMTIQKFKKNMTDIITVFDFVKKFLEEQDAEQKLMKDYDSFREFYAKLWLGLIQGDFVGKYRKEALEYIVKLYPDLVARMQPEDYFYDSMRTKWNGGIEVAKSLIYDPTVEYISFDIFDTLITRPLYKPQHVFELMDKEFKKLVHTNASFCKIRIDGENKARRQFGVETPEYQDVTLDEIYDEIQKIYDLDHAIVEQLKIKEIELEIRLSEQRKSIKELFDLAKYLKKKVIIVSDMYLTKNVIEAILKKHGYTGYEQLYLSSDIRLTKNTGDLFKYVLNDLAVSGNKILHFGDTWENDFVNPGNLGIRTFLIPKTREVFENIIQGQVTNRCATIGNWAAAGIIQQNSYKDSIGYGAMMAVIANKYFDNPYRTFNSETDLNADPYFIGYYPVGMHLYGFAKWLIEQGKMLGYKKLYFMSRDGYLPMLVYKKLAEKDDSAPKAEYLYSSRKALMPYIINSMFDLYDYPTVVVNQSAETMKKRLAFCIKEISDDDYREILKSYDIEPEKRFQDKEAYDVFVGIFIKEFYSEEVHKESKALCSDYYSQIEADSATVDMGYSGRIQGAVSEAVGHGVDVFFIHEDANQYMKESLNHNFQIHSFYGYTPCMSGVIREHILSSSEPSCIGFVKKNGQVSPVFEELEKNISDLKMIEQVQNGAVKFAEDFIDMLGEYRNQISIKPQEISLPYEGFIRFATSTDLRVFDASFFEDEVWGGATRINIAEFIKMQHNGYGHNNHFPDVQVIVNNVTCDHEKIKRIKGKLEKYPGLYKFAKKIYKRV